MSGFNFWKSKIVKISRFVLVFVLVASWIFSGWPRIWQKPAIPPGVQVAWAASLTYVGGTSCTGTGATYTCSLTALTGGIGSSAAAGNLVIVITGWASTANGDPGVNTAGYTEVADLYGNDTRDANVSVNWKIMSSTPDTSVEVRGFNNAANGGATVVQVWRYANATTPMDVTVTTATGTNGARPNSPSITPVTSGAYVLTAGLGTGDSTPLNFTAPTGYGNAISAAGAGSTMSAIAVIASKAWTSGAEDPGAWTGGESTTSDSWGAVSIAIRPAVTTLGSGTDPASAVVAPESGIRDAGSFTFSTTGLLDSVTALTVILSSGTGYDNLSEVRITSNDGATTYFSPISNPTSDTLNFSGGTSIPVTGSSVQFKIRVTPETHANMPAPPGGNYTFSPYVSAFTSGGNPAGSDSNANILTIDNLSPGGTTGASATPGDAQVTVSWTNPGDSDFYQVYIYCKTASISETPTEGTDPTVNANPCDAMARLKYKGTVSPQTFTGLTNDQLYYFRIFARDTNGNFTALVSTEQVSATPTSGPITTFLIGGTETGTKDTAVATITFPQAASETTVDAPYNNVDGLGDPQVLSATVSEPVVKIKNTGSSTYNIVLEITTWTNNLVNMEYYRLANDGATNIQTVTSELSNVNGSARTVSTGVSIAAGTYKDLYLKLILSSVAGKTGTSTLSVLGEMP